MKHLKLLVAAALTAIVGMAALTASPSAPTADAAVQQPYQCPSAGSWNVFKFPDSWFPQNDTSPRNNGLNVAGASLTGVKVDAASTFNLKSNDGAVAEQSNWFTVLLSGPSHAKDFSFGADGSYEWHPVDGYFGGDSFVYGYAANTVGCLGNFATVTIPPLSARVMDDGYTALNDRTFTTPSVCGNNGCGVLTNDLVTPAVSDAGFVSGATVFNIPLGAARVIGGGTLTLQGTGHFTFAPSPGFVGVSEFFYRAPDSFG